MQQQITGKTGMGQGIEERYGYGVCTLLQEDEGGIAAIINHIMC